MMLMPVVFNLDREPDRDGEGGRQLEVTPLIDRTETDGQRSRRKLTKS